MRAWAVSCIRFDSDVPKVRWYDWNGLTSVYLLENHIEIDASVSPSLMKVHTRPVCSHVTSFATPNTTQSFSIEFSSNEYSPTLSDSARHLLSSAKSSPSLPQPDLFAKPESTDANRRYAHPLSSHPHSFQVECVVCGSVCAVVGRCGRSHGWRAGQGRAALQGDLWPQGTAFAIYFKYADS